MAVSLGETAVSLGETAVSLGETAVSLVENVSGASKAMKQPSLLRPG